MKIHLSGQKVYQIRNALGMTVPQFAAVMAVHPGTVHRWESAGEHLVPIDGVAANLLVTLDQRISESQRGVPFHASDVGQEVIKGLLVGGALAALGLLIVELLKNGKK